jgi:S-adenosylmethionine hydrolase
VVDPGVGTIRRALAFRCFDGRLFVGPDNGLLWPAAERCGGVEAAVDIGQSQFRLEPVSATFHGRDVFAPVAARLALGTQLDEVGSPLVPERVRTCELPSAAVAPGEVRTTVLAVDRYGNLQLGLERDDLAPAGFSLGDELAVEAAGKTMRATFANTFADVEEGEAVVYEDASGMIAVALNAADAAATLGAGPDSALTMRADRR